jgi:anti-sigma factor RsiW
MKELKDIWQEEEGSGRLLEEQLLAYLEGRLPPEAQHEVERFLADEGLESDALEGLRQLGPKAAREAAGKLNQALHRRLKRKRPERHRYFSGNRWAWIAVLVVLMLVVLAYMVIRLSTQTG